MADIKLLLCRIRLHRWRWRTVGGIGFYGDLNVCTRCGKHNPDQRP